MKYLNLINITVINPAIFWRGWKFCKARRGALTLVVQGSSACDRIDSALAQSVLCLQSCSICTIYTHMQHIYIPSQQPISYFHCSWKQQFNNRRKTNSGLSFKSFRILPFIWFKPNVCGCDKTSTTKEFLFNARDLICIWNLLTTVWWNGHSIGRKEQRTEMKQRWKRWYKTEERISTANVSNSKKILLVFREKKALYINTKDITMSEKKFFDTFKTKYYLLFDIVMATDLQIIC